MSLLVWVLVPLVVSTMIAAGARRVGSPRRERPAPRELVRQALVVLPSGTDQRALLGAVSRVLDTDPRVDILVVESSAAPVAVDRVSHRVRVLRAPSVASETEALQAGAARGLRDGYDAVIELSLSQPRLARRITSLLEALDDGAHVAVGSRYAPGGRVVGCPYGRRVASRSANVALRWLTGARVCDVTAHIRAYRRAAVERALLPANGSARVLGVDVILRCHHAGLRVTEVPVTAAGPTCTAVTAADGRDLLLRALNVRRERPAADVAPPAIDSAEVVAASVGR